MKTQLENIAKIKLKSSEGKLHYSGYLYLRGTQITALPENLTVGGYLLSQLIGSREAITSYHIKHDVIHCECFKGTVSEFKVKVHSVYNSGKHREDYDAFITLAENWRKIYLSNKLL